MENMKHSVKVGLSFGLTSATITTLGLLVGLAAGTNSRIIVIGGILTIAIADSFSDAIGIHISEESEGHHSKKEIWEATLSTFFSKFLFALTFIVPLIMFSLTMAVIVGIVWGLSILVVLSYYVAKMSKSSSLNVIFEHVAVALLVIILTHYVGVFIGMFFV